MPIPFVAQCSWVEWVLDRISTKHKLSDKIRHFLTYNLNGSWPFVFLLHFFRTNTTHNLSALVMPPGCGHPAKLTQSSHFTFRSLSYEIRGFDGILISLKYITSMINILHASFLKCLMSHDYFLFFFFFFWELYCIVGFILNKNIKLHVNVLLLSKQIARYAEK